VLGATGSIGDSTMDLLRASPERYRVEALTGNQQRAGTGEARAGIRCALRGGGRSEQASELKEALAGSRTECGAGEVHHRAAPGRRLVMAAVSGAAGLSPRLPAVYRGATVALANKECLVCAGDFLHAARLERPALVSCRRIPNITRCSGVKLGQSRRARPRHSSPPRAAIPDLAAATSSSDSGAGTQTSELEHGAEDHHRFRIDDEQGLEIIEAAYLFATRAGRDRTFSCIRNRSSTAWLNLRPFGDRPARCARHAHPDRAIAWDGRPHQGARGKLDLAKIGQLTFEAPDFERFPALRLAYEALRTGRGATTVFNAANEVAVAAFIAGKIKFGAIARLVEATTCLDSFGNLAPLSSADDAIAVDHSARNKAGTYCLKLP